jgi:hypothetical protein
MEMELWIEEAIEANIKKGTDYFLGRKRLRGFMKYWAVSFIWVHLSVREK